MRKTLLLIFILLFMFTLTACAAGGNNQGSNEAPGAAGDNIENEGGENMGEQVFVLITLEDGRTIKLELFPEVAPITVANFLALVDANYYEGVIFHRVIENFMIQTGGYKVDDNVLGELGTTESIEGEFASNNHPENTLKHTVGVISMARTNIKNSATSQFFICVNDCPWLDGEYAGFGKVCDEESIKVIMDISKVRTGQLSPQFADFPYELIVIKTIKIINE